MCGKRTQKYLLIRESTGGCFNKFEVTASGQNHITESKRAWEAGQRYDILHRKCGWQESAQPMPICSLRIPTCPTGWAYICWLATHKRPQGQKAVPGYENSTGKRLKPFLPTCSGPSPNQTPACLGIKLEYETPSTQSGLIGTIADTKSITWAPSVFQHTAKVRQIKGGTVSTYKALNLLYLIY